LHSNDSGRARVRDRSTSAARNAFDAAYASLDLADLGWARAARSAPSDLMAAHPDTTPARVVRVDRGRHLLVAAGGEPPRHVHDRTSVEDVAVGDWLLVDDLVARARLPRSTVLARRRDTRSTAPQALAANVDLVLVAEALDPRREVNAHRVARFLAIAQAGDMDVLVVLTHADRVEGGAPELVAGTPTLAASIVDGRGIDELRERLGPGVTALVVGASGAGKSSLVNALVGEQLQAVTARRETGTGRHTTSTGVLVPLPCGGLLADTPGIRGVGMHAGVDIAALTPSTVDELAQQCRFRDCRHDGEPGCAVGAAIAAGDLPEDAVTAWRRLEREALREQARADDRLRRELAAARMVDARAYTRARRRGEHPQRRS
jgi:ribosome biogenesis GTPase